MTTIHLTGGEAVVASLRAHGVTTLYGLPGLQLDHLFNALHGASGWLQVVSARHEQGAAYMALGHAQSTGRPGVYACVPGPGFLNTTAALSTAYAVHAPVLALIGQADTSALGLGGGELPDQTASVRGLTRWHGIAHHAGEVLPLMEIAFRKLAAGIAPVAVELPADVLRNRMSAASVAAVAPVRRLQPGPSEVAAAVGLLAGAGAKSANSGRVVVALCGDGGLLFTGNEMATAVQHGIAAIAVVFVDGAFGNVQRIQRQQYGKIIASDLTNPDFVRFGARARAAGSPQELARALRWAMAEDGPTLIAVAVPKPLGPYRALSGWSRSLIRRPGGQATWGGVT